MRVAGLILAGGKAFRMGGGDKGLLRLGGRSLLAHVAARLLNQVCCIAISANGDPARFGSYPWPVLPDAAQECGPLAGVLAGLEWAGREGANALLTAPTDTPFIPLDLGRRLQPAPAYPAGPERAHHLVALWPVAAAAGLRQFLDAGGRLSVARFAASIGSRRVMFGSEAPFLNLNTPEELESARAEEPDHNGPR